MSSSLLVNMAGVRHRLGRGAYDFVHKVCNRQCLERPGQPGKGAIHISSLSAGFLSDDVNYGGLYEAADREAGYTTGTPELHLHYNVCTERDVSENHYNGDLKDDSPSFQSKTQVVGRNGPRCWFRRTLWNSSASRRSHGQFVLIRSYSGDGNRTWSEPLYKTRTGYYEILEVLPSATQAQIKTAYYKQSFAYHPDRNAGSGEATVRFSEISEAYSVLGNKMLRKKYDRGLLSLSDLTATVRPSARDGAGASTQQPTGGRRSPLSSDIRGGVFDFDIFFKSHYSEQLQRQRDTRVRQEEMRKKKEEPMVEKRLGVTMEMCGGLVLVMAIVLIISLKRM